MATPSHFQIINKNQLFQMKIELAIRVGNASSNRKCGVHNNVLLNIREPHHQETILCFSRIRQILVFPLKLQPHTTHHPPPTTHHPLKQLICINKYRLILYGLMSFCGWFFIYLLGSRALNGRSRSENSYWWVVFILS